jgi:hypothetical protein
LLLPAQIVLALDLRCLHLHLQVAEGTRVDSCSMAAIGGTRPNLLRSASALH